MTITKQEKEVFDYLNELRESGITNMYGVTSYIMNRFGLSENEARVILSSWMKNFNEDGYEDLVE